MSRENAPNGGDWQDLVVICSGTHWDRWYPSEKHIALRLCARTPVLYVDPPSSPIARGRGAERPTGLRIVQPRLAVLSPRGLPAQSRPVMRTATSFLTRRAIARAVRALGAKHVRALIVANHTCLFQAVQAQHRVMFATDDFVAGAGLMGLGRDYLLAEERKQANEADHVIVVTEQLGEHWRALGQKPILIPNGCDTERFADTDMAPWPEDVDLPRPIAGVFGHLSERIDLRLLQAVADRGHSLLLVGTLRPSFSLENLLARRNVRYVGAKPFEAMPSYLRSIDVGLTPYADIEFNRASFPLKTLEYLAAGRPAVSTDLPAARWLDTDLVRVARDPRAFADAVDSLMSQPRTAELARECQAFARRHSWLARTEAFAGILGLPEPAANAA